MVCPQQIPEEPPTQHTLLVLRLKGEKEKETLPTKGNEICHM